MCGGGSACPAHAEVALGGDVVALISSSCAAIIAAAANQSDLVRFRGLTVQGPVDAVSFTLSATLVAQLPPGTGLNIDSVTCDISGSVAVVRMTIWPAVGRPLPSSAVAAALEAQLPIAVTVLGSTRVTRTGTCGNGVCEVGERCVDGTPCAVVSSCALDCGAPSSPLEQPQSCLLPEAGLGLSPVACSAAGACDLRLGAGCACTTGAAGYACQRCADAYFRPSAGAACTLEAGAVSAGPG